MIKPRTIKMPLNHRVHLDLDLSVPENLPPQGARIEIKVFPDKVTLSESHDAAPMENQNIPNDFNEFFGIFKGKHIWDGDPAGLIRKTRDEW
ncbi:MAG: hypothetical protein LBQ57_09295 [Spirochaetales bacterium]|jgi:hypothetical protein|nr:hypothetical protein [Spirochaetales bacterium]